MRTKMLLVLGAVLAMLAVAVPAQAIKGGVADAGAHPYAGQLLFYDPTASGSGGNDVWISFAEVPDYSILPPSSEFIPDDNEGRYDAWSAALNASDEWIRATAYPHPDYDDAAFFTHDLGVLRLSEPVNLPEGEVLQQRQHRRHLLR